MTSQNCDPAKLLPLTKEEKRACVIDVVTHLAQLAKKPVPDAFTAEWKEVIGDGIEQMWQFLEDFVKREGLT